MHFGLTNEQHVLQEESGRFFANLAPKARACDPAAWPALTELGWQAIAIAHDAGGSGGGMVDLAVVLAEAGKVALALPLVSTAGLAGTFLSRTGAEGIPYLARIAGGDAATLAFHGEDLTGLAPGGGVAVEGGRITGVRTLVTDARRARWSMVPCVDAGIARLVIVENVAAQTLEEFPGMDPARPLSRMTFYNTPIADVLPLDLEAASARAFTALSAELLGVAEAALKQAIAYALEREQFGQRIGTFQAVKHRLADCYVAVERARSLVFAAAMLCDDDDVHPRFRSTAASMAKAAASEAALGSTAADVQIHAAIAVTTEHTALQFARRARQGSVLLGTHVAHLANVGHSFVKETALGHS